LCHCPTISHSIAATAAAAAAAVLLLLLPYLPLLLPRCGVPSAGGLCTLLSTCVTIVVMTRSFLFK
jgi:hypothetical protein